MLVAVLAAAAMAAILFALVRSSRIEREHAARRASRARELGWVYRESGEGDISWRMSGVSRGLRWELEYDSDKSSSESSPRILWYWRERPAHRIELAIMSGALDRMVYGAMGRGMISLAMRIGVKPALYPDGGDFYRHSQRVESDLSFFQKDWIVRARNPARFRSVASSELAELLSRWPDHALGLSFRPAAVVNLSYSEDGLRLECRSGVTDMAVIEHLVRIGCAVAVKLAGMDLGRA
jgi:hypothetical protein